MAGAVVHRYDAKSIVYNSGQDCPFSARFDARAVLWRAPGPEQPAGHPDATGKMRSCAAGPIGGAYR